ncbi:MAG: NrsF family protein [Alphaproteobacteria bacterium]
MITTPDLIEALVSNVAPVRRLRPPLTRAACWLLFGMLVVVLLAVGGGVRPDLMERLREATFSASVAGAILTGMGAAIAAFVLSLPGRSNLWALLPVPPLVLWLSTVGYQCATSWVPFGPGGIEVGEVVRCVATLVLTSLPLSIVMLLMLLYAAPLRPTRVILMGSLAVAAITATALSLFHSVDATALVLMWNFGTAALFLGLGSIFGNMAFSWVASRTGPRTT